VARELGIWDDNAEGRMVLADALMDANDKGDLRADFFPAGIQLPYRIMES
jgi:hypothetical protein